MILRRRPVLPEDLREAWAGFLDCAARIEAARRLLLGTLPTGRVEPAPPTVGLAELRRAVAEVRAWMPRWRIDGLDAVWERCLAALDEADSAAQRAAEVAAATTELEELLAAVEEVVDPLDAFADAEAEWRRRFRIPRELAG